MVVDISKITEKKLEELASEDDLNQACYDAQSEIGQTDGGVAGIYFAGDGEEKWIKGNKDTRIQMMKEYLELEKTYSGLSE